MTKPQADPSDVTVFAPAKINLILRILGRRPDGFHDLWSIMHTVGLADEIRIRLQPDRDGIQLRCDDAQLAVDQTNLVSRAAAAVLERSKLMRGLDIYLQKRIPMGAGLGGGSSDAAATLIGVNHLLQLGWSIPQLADVGASLGSDVPFFLFAPSAFVAGRGETVRPVAIQGTRWVVLVNPGFGVNTKWAYQELAATRRGVRPLSMAQQQMDRQPSLNWPQLEAAAENDFEAPVFATHETLREIKQRMVAQGATMALLSGSGATVFGLFTEESVARRAAAQFERQAQLKVFVVPTGSGPLIARSQAPG